MGSITAREDLAGFLDDPQNARKLNGLVEDIRYVMMDYQVRTPRILVHQVPNICLRLRYNETSTKRAANKS